MYTHSGGPGLLFSVYGSLGFIWIVFWHGLVPAAPSTMGILSSASAGGMNVGAGEPGRYACAPLYSFLRLRVSVFVLIPAFMRVCVSLYSFLRLRVCVFVLFPALINLDGVW